MISEAKLEEALKDIKVILEYDEDEPPNMPDTANSALIIMLTALISSALMQDAIMAYRSSDPLYQEALTASIDTMRELVVSSGVVEGHPELIAVV